MREIKLIVIHCSASPNGDSLFCAGQTPVRMIDGWHRTRGFKRATAARLAFNPDLWAIGYHFVICTNGAIATGRSLDEQGAHAKGYNARSIGVCMVGTDAYTAAQWSVLRSSIEALRKKFPDIRIVGHRDLSPDINGDGTVEPREWLKTCPGFDVSAWLADGMAPLAGHLLEESKQ